MLGASVRFLMVQTFEARSPFGRGSGPIDLGVPFSNYPWRPCRTEVLMTMMLLEGHDSKTWTPNKCQAKGFWACFVVLGRWAIVANTVKLHKGSLNTKAIVVAVFLDVPHAARIVYLTDSCHANLGLLRLHLLT